ncbi:transglutaminase-like domain-containing protein [Neobacillus mesonae]|nr:transglutaminase-like domain-containing protein [Neobacillus mesonae]
MNGMSLSDKSSAIVNQEPWYFRMSASVVLFIMFVEWLMPGGIGEQLHSKSAPIMLLLTALLLLTGTWKMTLGVSLLIRAGVSFLCLWWFMQSFSDSFWILEYLQTLKQDLSLWLDGAQIHLISDETKSIIIILGWSLFVTSVQMLVIQLRTVLLFGLVSILYLIGIELVNGEDGSGGMIRVVCCFLLLQVLMQLPRLRSSGSLTNIDKSRYMKWTGIAVGSVLLICGAAAAVSSIIPSKQPDSDMLTNARAHILEWADYLRRSESESAFATTGYDAGGRDMGAPLVPGNEVFFTGYSPVATYWRGQSRSLYDGRSWKSSYSNAESVRYISTAGRIREEEIEENPYFRLIQQTVELQAPAQGGSDIFTGGVPVRLIMNNPTEGTGEGNENKETGQNKNNQRFPYVLSEFASGNLRFDDIRPYGPGSVTSYSADVLVPIHDLSGLRNLNGTDPAEIRRTNLQLPSSLPKRVRELGEEITDGASSRYDAVMAVAAYLKSNYTYSLDTRVPGAGQDFVDDFLFTMRKGYCNHFSTAMVVLLRSEGIPARYVQGFSPGKRSADNPNEYIVTQGDAHAWVEVYFPNVGWLPFEATPGFGAEESGSLPAIVSAQEDDDETSGWAGTVLQEWLAAIVQPLTLAWTAAGAFLIAAAAVAGRRYSPALRLRLRLVFPRSNTFPDRERLLAVGAPVWDRVAQRYGAREPGLTLKEYTSALPFDEPHVHEEMLHFAADWEALVYGSVSFSRAASTAFLNRCLRISKLLK